jgi:transcriptional regulator with XRE-family HTH domain
MNAVDDLRAKIRRQMVVRKLSLRQLGELSGVAHTTIAGWMGTANTQPRPPHLAAALAVARSLGISLDELGK